MSKIVETLTSILNLLEREGNVGTAMNWQTRISPDAMNVGMMMRQYQRDVAAVKAAAKASEPKKDKPRSVQVYNISIPEDSILEWDATNDVSVAMKACGKHRLFNLKKMPDGFVDELESSSDWQTACSALMNYAAGGRGDIKAFDLYRNLVKVLYNHQKKWSIDKNGGPAHYLS